MQFNYTSGDPIVHPQTTVTVANGPQLLTIEVDEGIADLIEALWRAGYRTVASCQDQSNTGRAWVGFENKQQAARFQRATRHIGGTYPEVNARDFAKAPPDDPFRHGAVGVTFPAALIEHVTQLFTR